jgi:hypothetical protein
MPLTCAIKLEAKLETDLKIYGSKGRSSSIKAHDPEVHTVYLPV